MNKASLLYGFLALALIAGTWVILKLGATLQAPTDLSGTWELRWDTPASDLPSSMTIEQSGLFVTATVGKNQHLHTLMEKHPEGYRLRLDAADAHGRIVLSQVPFARSIGQLPVAFEGSLPRSGRAYRRTEVSTPAH